MINKSYVKVLMSNDLKFDLKVKALKRNLSLSSLLLEMIESKHNEDTIEYFKKQLEHYRFILSNIGSEMTKEEREHYKDRIRQMKEHIKEIEIIQGGQLYEQFRTISSNND